MLVALLLAVAIPCTAQTNGGAGATLPGTCIAGSTYVRTGASAGFYFCSATDTWTQVGGGSSEGVPVGSILLIKSGTCPTGYTEDTDLNGRTVIGTLAANGNVGTTGGSDTLTPSGTIAWPAGVPTHTGTAASFTGNALGTHAHELPLHGGTTPRITAGYGTGTSIAGTRALTNTAQTTAQAVLLSQAISAGTPSGTVTITNQGSVAWPAGVPTLSGAAGDNRSAFIRTIFCRKT